MKGVISKITPDEEMPILETGERIEMKCAILGVGGRINPSQLYEVEENFQSNRIVDIMKTYDDYRYKANILFKYLFIVNPAYAQTVKDQYDSDTEDGKKEYIEEIEKYKIHLQQPPMYNNITIQQLAEVYDTFDIKPVKAYVKKWGRMIPLMNDVVAGEKYVLVLKHHPKSKFSSRSTGFINSKDLPTKSSTTKQNKSIYPTTPIKWGGMETLNLLLNNNPEALTKLFFLYSSSIKARRDIDQLYEGPINLEELKISEDATNRNAEIFNVNLKAGGIGYRFIETDDNDSSMIEEDDQY